MKAFLKKIKNNISVYLKFNNKQNSFIKKRINENELLRKKRKSDINRWQNNNNLFSNWNERTSILGDFIKPNSNIFEFGAGNMFLKSYLTNYKSYTPSDIIKRFDETIVCDLNNKLKLDIKNFDVVVLSGVLEYVYDIDTVFYQFRKNNIK